MHLQEFRSQFLESLLQFLWRQWSALGVSGYSETEDKWVIDPEALLLLSCSIARYDQRLLDEILDWLMKNERFINVQRLKSLLRKEKFASEKVIRAIAGQIYSTNKGLKWKGLCENKEITQNEEPLFFLKNHKPMPVTGEKDPVFMKYGFTRNLIINRNLSTTFPKKKITSLLLQLRGFLGVNARAEILLHLLIHKQATIQEIADSTGFSWKSVQDTLFEMGHSALLHFPEVKRGRVYYFDSDPWFPLLLDQPPQPIQPIVWPPLFSALDAIWNLLKKETFLNADELTQSAELKQLSDNFLILKFTQAGFGSEMNKLSGIYGKEYCCKWATTFQEILVHLKKSQ